MKMSKELKKREVSESRFIFILVFLVIIGLHNKIELNTIISFFTYLLLMTHLFSSLQSILFNKIFRNIFRLYFRLYLISNI